MLNGHHVMLCPTLFCPILPLLPYPIMPKICILIVLIVMALIWPSKELTNNISIQFIHEYIPIVDNITYIIYYILYYILYPIGYNISYTNKMYKLF
jgi:hypothetical protein